MIDKYHNQAAQTGSMRCIYRWLRPLACILLLSAQNPALAELISPITLSNYSPVVAIHGLPYIGDAQVLKPGRSDFQLMYDDSSHYAIDFNDNEYILLDGETHRSTFIYRQGLTNGLEAGLVVPYLKHTAGGLDSFINEWHQFFGFPQGGRELTANNQFRYQYIRHSRTRFDMRTASGGIGDIRLQGAWQVQNDATRASALALSIKLPSGDSEQFQGSGATDVALWYKHEAQQAFFGYRGGSFYSLGVLYEGRGDILPDMVNPVVGFGNIGAGVSLGDNAVFVSQLDINSPFYSSSDLVELGSYAVQLTLGSRIKFAPYGQISLGLAEDLVIDASPDVTFHVAVELKF